MRVSVPHGGLNHDLFHKVCRSINPLTLQYSLKKDALTTNFLADGVFVSPGDLLARFLRGLMTLEDSTTKYTILGRSHRTFPHTCDDKSAIYIRPNVHGYSSSSSPRLRLSLESMRERISRACNPWILQREVKNGDVYLMTFGLGRGRGEGGR